MASTSSSSMASQKQHQVKKYDVFVSFRGEDVRYGFLSHLSAALHRKKIITFIDDKIEKGEMISESLVKAIEDSQLSIIIFSENYASSRWCLEEVAEIIRCRERMGQMVVPVYYHVDPSHVRKQSGSFADAFAGHEEKHEREKVEKWRSALTKAGSLSGWHMHEASATRYENEVVDDIVGAVLKQLNRQSSSNIESLVGKDSLLKQMELLLCVGKADVGIWGMGGIDKTAVAEAVFHRISSQFEGCCFLANVREEWEKYGRTYLQGKLLSAILGNENLNKASSNMGHNKFIRDRLRRSKVLIVLDDVDNLEHLEFLVGECDCFGHGSRIIITSRNKQVLHGRVDKIYEITVLSDPDALRLFSRYAFKRNHPTEGFEELSSMIVKYANGNPLALKVMGAALFCKSKKVWDSALNKLKKSPLDEIQGTLRISFDGLGKEEKNIFLDIACFFKGDNEDDVTRILDGCGFHTQFGLSILVDKSLIYIKENKIWMHDLVQQMGRAIVFDESEQPSKRSRLWIPKETTDVLRKNKGTENVEGIILDLSGLINDVHFPAKTFERMEKLKLLKIYSNLLRWHYGDICGKACKIHLFQGLDYLPEELRCLWWHKYPLKSLPSNFDPENLVDLDLCYSDIEEPWNGVQDFPNLKFLDLSHCQRLIKTPDFSATPNLMRIYLKECTGLVDVHPSIWALDNLTELNLINCKEVRSFPGSIHLKSLETLNLSGCSNLMKFPDILEKMECLKSLDLREIAIEEVPSSIENLIGLRSLSLVACKRLKSLPSNIGQLKSLKYLILSGCSKLESLPSCIWQLDSLIELHLYDCSNLESLPEISEINEKLRTLKLGGRAIRELPSSIDNLTGLLYLELNNCKSIDTLPSSIFNLKSLERLFLSGCSKLQRLPCSYSYQNSTELLPCYFPGSRSLTNQDPSSCNLLEVPRELGHLVSLIHLHLNGSDIVSIPPFIKHLSHLKRLEVENCQRLQSLPELPPSIIVVNAYNCIQLKIVTFPSELFVGSSTWLKYLWWDYRVFNFINCLELDEAQRINIQEEAVRLIKIIATPLIEVLLQQDRLDSGIHPLLGVFLPETEFLEWFSNQSMGSSVTIQLPLDWLKCGFMEFVVCALFECKGLITDHICFLEFKCTFNTAFGNWSFNSGFYHSWEIGDILLMSDHLFVGYGALVIDEWPNKCYPTKASFEFSMGDCKIKKCGVRLVSHQDKNDNNPTVMKLIATPSLELQHQKGRLKPGLHPLLGAFFPEIEFVMCFINQSMGSSVTVQLPPDWLKCSFMQFYACALLECRGVISNLDDYIECKCSFNNEFGNTSFDFRVYLDWKFGGRLLKSDHMLLGYGTLVMDEWPNKCYPTEALFQISVVGIDCKVKKCGVHLVWAQDKKDNNPTVMQQASSSQNFGKAKLEDTNVKDFHDHCSKEPNPKKLKLLEFH